MRIMAVVMAANMNLNGIPTEWPIHIYKSPSCVATAIAYAISHITVSNALYSKVLGQFLPKPKSLASIWADFQAARDQLYAQPIPEIPNEGDILAWSADSVRIHKELMDRALPVLKSHFADVLLNLTISTLATNALVWPLKKVMAWMVVQSEGEITAFSKTPWTIVKEIFDQGYYPRGRRNSSLVQGGGSILSALAGFYTGYPTFALQALSQLALNSLAAGFALYGINYLYSQLTQFMNYQQSRRKIYDKKVASPMEATYALYNAAFITVRKLVPFLCILGLQGSLIAGRLVAVPLSLVSTVRLVADSPSISSGAYVHRLAQQSDLGMISSLFSSKLISTWIGWGWKWLMLGVPLGMLGLSTTIVTELQ
jgi:hypothetical protein